MKGQPLSVLTASCILVVPDCSLSFTFSLAVRRWRHVPARQPIHLSLQTAAGAQELNIHWEGEKKNESAASVPLLAPSLGYCDQVIYCHWRPIEGVQNWANLRKLGWIDMCLIYYWNQTLAVPCVVCNFYLTATSTHMSHRLVCISTVSEVLHVWCTTFMTCDYSTLTIDPTLCDMALSMFFRESQIFLLAEIFPISQKFWGSENYQYCPSIVASKPMHIICIVDTGSLQDKSLWHALCAEFL